MSSRRSKPSTFAGVDVSSAELVISYTRGRDAPRLATVPNTPAGHLVLLRILGKKAGCSRVVLEATGTYHLDVALTLAGKGSVELMVVNPLAARRFAQAQMRRAKTDKVDADVLREFASRMPLEPWVPPSAPALELRAVARHLSSLVADQTAAKNQIAAAGGTTTTPAFVVADLKALLAALEARIEANQKEAERVIAADPGLAAQFASILSMKGLGKRSSVLLLGELAVLDKEMSPDEVVAHAGLDPRPYQSGTRDPQRRISKVGNARVRAGLYMPALTAATHCPEVKAWFDRLIAKGKPTFVAHVAVMRRLLRVMWVLVKRGGVWDPQKFLPRGTSAAAAPDAPPAGPDRSTACQPSPGEPKGPAAPAPASVRPIRAASKPAATP